jgi:3-deoxy-D-manno-octulosonate cytidylyltransferase
MIKFLDCTLRDGGYYTDWKFEKDLVNQYLFAMSETGVDIVELGFRFLNTLNLGASAYTTDEYLESLDIPKNLKIAVMINASDVIKSDNIISTLEKLFPKNSDNCLVDMVRIASHPYEVQDVLPATSWLKERGFDVGFNIMQINEESESTVKDLVSLITQYPIDVLYFADSLGNMTPDKVKTVIDWLRTKWQKDIGIHTHDNIGLALQNTLTAIDTGVTYVDSTVTGMGRGPGNTRTEVLTIEIAERTKKKINPLPLLSIVSDYFLPLKEIHGWGTNPYYYMSGKYSIHPSYVQYMLANKSNFPKNDILKILEYLRFNNGRKFDLKQLEEYKNNLENNIRSVIIIPARYASTRYPGKPLVEILGKPLIQWVAELCTDAVGHDNVYVATDSDKIKSVVENVGYKVIMTSEALTGTDRIAEAAEKIDADIFINVQGDEPLVNPNDIKRIIKIKEQNLDKIINGYRIISSDENPHNVNIPKVLVNENNKLVYMSRNVLPGCKEFKNAPTEYKKQVCIYAFTIDELRAFRNYGRKSIIESYEDIEILRFLELDKEIFMVETKEESLAVDSPGDVIAVEEALKRRLNNAESSI